ncbi:MAG: hypothetical protein ACI8W8_004436, partial [Rhodothermales bacterium]
MDKRDLPLAAACVLVLVWYMMRVANAPPPVPEPGTIPNDPSITVNEGEPTPPAQAPAVDGETPTPAPPADTGDQGTEAKPDGPEVAAGFAELAAAKRFDLTRDEVFTLHLDPEAGGIREATLLQHRNEARDGPIKIGSVLHPMYTVQSGEDEWRFTHAKVTANSATEYRI